MVIPVGLIYLVVAVTALLFMAATAALQIARAKRMDTLKVVEDPLVRFYSDALIWIAVLGQGIVFIVAVGYLLNLDN